jgi:hypothetical protein
VQLRAARWVPMMAGPVGDTPHWAHPGPGFDQSAAGSALGGPTRPVSGHPCMQGGYTHNAGLGQPNHDQSRSMQMQIMLAVRLHGPKPHQNADASVHSNLVHNPEVHQ